MSNGEASTNQKANEAHNKEWPFNLYSVPTNDDESWIKAEEEISIISWNILAESYLSPRSHPNLPEPSREVVFEPERRRELLRSTLKKLVRSCKAQHSEENKRCDVMCLQEVDLFEEVVEPHMKRLGYEGIEAKREGRVDSCAIFWNDSKYDLVGWEMVSFDDLAREEEVPMATASSTEDEVIRDIQQRKTQYRAKKQPSEFTGIVQSFLRRNSACMAVLQHSETKERMAISSAHLYWNPNYEYVKLAQAKFLLDNLHRFALAHSHRDSRRMSVFVCGDMNSKPDSLVYRFYVDGVVDARRVAPWHTWPDPLSDDADQEQQQEVDKHDYTPIASSSHYSANAASLSNEMNSLQINDLEPFLDNISEQQELEQPLPSVRYIVDYSLNKFSRWLRMFGIDAALETEQEEKLRTKTSDPQIIIFDRCQEEKRTLVTTSYKLLQRKGCPPGAYLINPSKDLKQALCHLLLTHGIVLEPSAFLSRCVVCNGEILLVEDEEQIREIFQKNNAPILEDHDVFCCSGCQQGYWWSEHPNSSASRVKNAVEFLFRLALRAGVPYKGDLGIFDFIDVEEERKKGIGLYMNKMEALEWIRSDKLAHPFKLRSVYEHLPFTNVTHGFVGTLDYIFFEKEDWELKCSLFAPTSFTQLNVDKVLHGHLIPSHLWPSDHLAIGCTLRKKKKVMSQNQPQNKKETIHDLITFPSLSHGNRCACGCVPKNILSLFEMAELRKQYKASKKISSSDS